MMLMSENLISCFFFNNFYLFMVLNLSFLGILQWISYLTIYIFRYTSVDQLFNNLYITYYNCINIDTVVSITILIFLQLFVNSISIFLMVCDAILFFVIGLPNYKLMAVTSSNLNGFSKFFIARKRTKFSIKIYVLFPTTP